MTKARTLVEQGGMTLYDVGDCVRLWGRRGILGGALLGFVLGVGHVTTTGLSTFEIIGVLIVASVEGAAVAGVFGACAALFGKGVLCGNAARHDRARSSERQRSEVIPPKMAVPTSDWPARWAYPCSATELPSKEK